MKRFVEGVDRGQATLFPEYLEDWICEDNPVRAVDVFVDELDLAELGFGGVDPEATGRPSYHPLVLLKLYIYGYLNRVQSSRRLEREAGRNIEGMWRPGRPAPDHKAIADFRRDNGPAIRKVCAQFVAPETFNFLGFTFICGNTRAGKFQIRRKTRADRMRAKLKMIKAELWRRMHQPIPKQGKWLGSVVKRSLTY